MAHWLLELSKGLETGTTPKTKTTANGGLTPAEMETYGKLFAGTEVPEGNIFLWALAQRKQLEANAEALGLVVKFPEKEGDKRIVWSAPKGHSMYSGSGRVARCKDTGSIALCYGSKVSGASGLGGTKEKERRSVDLQSLWVQETVATEATPKKTTKKKGKSIKK